MVTLGGLVNAHTHLWRTFVRGLPRPRIPPRDLPEALERIWWPLARAHDLETIRWSARVGIVEAVRAGATCLFDHHESPNAIEGSLDVVADELERAGVRGVVSYAASGGTRGDAEWQAGLAENERFLRENRRSLVRGMVGLSACFTVPDEAIAEAAAMARQFRVGLHVQVAEHDIDRDAFARLLRSRGIVAGSLYAHGTRLSAQEVRQLTAAGGWVVQAARGDQVARSGWARLDAGGARVALGTDGVDGDLLAEARALRACAAQAGEAVDALSRLEAGRALQTSLFGDTGWDRVELAYDPPTPLADGNLEDHLLSGAPRVAEVVVAGRRVEPSYDPAEARRLAAALWLRFQNE